MNRDPSELDERIAREFLRWTPPPSMPDARPPAFSKNWCTCHNLIEEIRRRKGVVSLWRGENCMACVDLTGVPKTADASTLPEALCKAILACLDHANSTTEKP